MISENLSFFEQRLLYRLLPISDNGTDFCVEGNALVGPGFANCPVTV